MDGEEAQTVEEANGLAQLAIPGSRYEPGPEPEDDGLLPGEPEAEPEIDAEAEPEPEAEPEEDVEDVLGNMGLSEEEATGAAAKIQAIQRGNQARRELAVSLPPSVAPRRPCAVLNISHALPQPRPRWRRWMSR